MRDQDRVLLDLLDRHLFALGHLLLASAGLRNITVQLTWRVRCFEAALDDVVAARPLLRVPIAHLLLCDAGSWRYEQTLTVCVRVLGTHTVIW